MIHNTSVIEKGPQSVSLIEKFIKLCPLFMVSIMRGFPSLFKKLVQQNGNCFLKHVMCFVAMLE